MALSDYLTSEEWNACFYRLNTQTRGETVNFGVIMRETINELLSNGYQFEGLNEKGHKKRQICNGVNAPKILLFMGNPKSLSVCAILEDGRDFIKEHLPHLLFETDAVWEQILPDLKAGEEQIRQARDKAQREKLH